MDDHWPSSEALIKALGLNKKYFEKVSLDKSGEIWATAFAFTVMAYYYSKRRADLTDKRLKLEKAGKKAEEVVPEPEIDLIRVVTYLTKHEFLLSDQLPVLEKSLSHLFK